MKEDFGRFFREGNYLKIKNSLFNYMNRKKEISGVFRSLKPEYDWKMLDIGSGVSPVSPIPSKTMFMDISRDAVRIMKSKGYDASFGSITKMKFKDKFDVIFCSEVLEHVKDYGLALKNMEKSLKNDGKAIITVPVYMKYWGMDDEFVNHIRRFEPEDFRKKLDDCGLRVIREKPIGSLLERKLTLLIVKAFKSNPEREIGNLKTRMIILINYLLYLLVRISVLIGSKKSASVMLYLCERKD